MTALDRSYPYAYPIYSYRPRGDFQTLVYGVWTKAGYRLAWITVLTKWLREEASLNDLEALALKYVEENDK